MSAAAVGAFVQYCGHRGYFIADIFELGSVNVVSATGPVTPGNIKREEMHLVTHHLSDFPSAGYWKPERGVFVVPKNQVKEVEGAKRNVEKKTKAGAANHQS